MGLPACQRYTNSFCFASLRIQAAEPMSGGWYSAVVSHISFDKIKSTHSRMSSVCGVPTASVLKSCCQKICASSCRVRGLPVASPAGLSSINRRSAEGTNKTANSVSHTKFKRFKANQWPCMAGIRLRCACMQTDHVLFEFGITHHHTKSVCVHSPTYDT